jgi:hypothetical protein
VSITPTARGTEISTCDGDAVVSVLRLEPLLFPARFTTHRVRVLVDDIDVVAVVYGPGGFFGQPVAGFTPSFLLGSPGLTASPDGREVALGGSDTTEDRLTVQIRAVDSAVIWDRWRMLDMERVVKEGPDVGLDAFRFDARAYASELDRARRQADLRPPARPAPRLTVLRGLRCSARPPETLPHVGAPLFLRAFLHRR